MADLKKDLLAWLDQMQGVADKNWFGNLRTLIKHVPPGLEGKVLVCLFIGKLAESEPSITNVKLYPENAKRLFKLANAHGLLSVAEELSQNPDLLKTTEVTRKSQPPRK